MAVKPTEQIDWVSDGAPDKLLVPNAAKRLAGYVADARPPAKEHNWIFFILDQWVKYLEEVTDDIAGFANIYSAFVGGPAALATHAATSAGFQQAINDSGVGDKILVLDPISMDAQVQVSKNDMVIEFHPRAIMTRDAGAPADNFKAIRMTGTGIQLLNANMRDFDQVGDFAITLDAASNFCRIVHPRFKGNTEDVELLNLKSALVSPLTE